MDISKILDQVKSGGFVNPIRSSVDSAIGSISIPTVDELRTLAQAQVDAHGGSLPNDTQLQTAHDSIVSAMNKTQDLLGHTDRISGVNLTGNGTLGTIAKTMGSARNINGDLSCSTVLSAFGSIIKSSEVIGNVVTMTNNVKEFLSDIPNQINLIPTILTDYVDAVGAQIESDIGVLAQAKMDIIQHSLANNLVELFQDECASQILSAVMTQSLKNEVSTVVDMVKSKKISSLGK